MLFIPLFILMGIIVSSVSGFGEFSLAHYLMLGALYSLYYLIFINLTLIVSWFSKQSGSAFITLLAVWIVATLVLPKLFVSTAQYMNPLPDTNTVAEMYREARAGGVDGHVPSSARELEKQVMEEYGVDTLEDLPFNFAGYRLQAGEEYDTKAYNHVFSHIRSTISDQDALIRKGSLLSPFLPVRNLSMAMAYTDVNTHWDFSEAVERYRQEFVLYLNEDLMFSSRTGETYLAGSDVWAAKPGFSYELPEMVDVMKAQTGNLFLLFGWVVFSFLGLLTIRLKSEGF
jgi:ABC-2 type transport system permease protein